MAIVYLVPIDLGKNELQNARVQNLSTAPSSPVTGQMYYDTDDNKLYWWNGSGWVAAEGGTPVLDYGEVGDISASAPGDTAAAGATAEVADAGHRHAREAYGATGDIDSITFGQTGAAGSVGKVADAGHVHPMAAHDDTAHNTVELADLATSDGNYSMGGNLITSHGTPSAGTDVANKDYVDGVAQGLDAKASVRVATTAAGTLASSFENADSVDGVTLATGDRILIKNQAAAAENGIYTVNASGAPTRALDANSWSELVSAYVWVEEGTANADTGWVSTVNTGGTLGSTAVTFVQFASAGAAIAGAGLTKSGNTLDVGAGTGMVANTDDVAVLRTDANGRVPLLYAVSVGNGSNTSFNVDHNLNSLDVIVQVYRVSDGVEVEVDKTRSTVNRVIVAFATAPTSNQYRVVVHG